jgi:hypothetical protein
MFKKMVGEENVVNMAGSCGGFERGRELIEV